MAGAGRVALRKISVCQGAADGSGSLWTQRGWGHGEETGWRAGKGQIRKGLLSCSAKGFGSHPEDSQGADEGFEIGTRT